jgi:hypothetical protein
MLGSTIMIGLAEDHDPPDRVITTKRNRSGKILVGLTPGWEDRSFRRHGRAVMEWVIKLEAKCDRGDIKTIEVGGLERRIVGLTAAEVGLTLAEGPATWQPSPNGRK